METGFGGAGFVMHSITSVDDVSGQREVCRAFDKAPHALIAGASTLAMFNELVQPDLLFRATSLACMRRTFSPVTPFGYPFVR